MIDVKNVARLATALTGSTTRILFSGSRKKNERYGAKIWAFAVQMATGFPCDSHGWNLQRSTMALLISSSYSG